MDDFDVIVSDDPAVSKILADAKKAEDGGDLNEAIALYRKAADSGCSDAMVHLAMMLMDRSDDERREAIALLEKADEAGNPSGTRDLAYCYAVGIGVEKNKELGAKLYIKAAEAGNAKAMCNIGVMYSYGNGVEQDFVKAAEWYRKSAEGGYSRGMTDYACCLRDGKGVERDPELAAEWFARSKSPRAKRLLAIMKLNGDGIPSDPKGARELLEDACATDSKSMVILGDMIFDEDRERAVSLFTKAASKGNADAISRLEKLGLPIPESTSRMRKKKSGCAMLAHRFHSPILYPRGVIILPLET